MKFTVHTKELNKALGRLSAVRSLGPSAVAIMADSLGGLFLQRDTTLVSMRIECPAEIEEEGIIAVSFAGLHQRIARTASEKIEVKLAKDKLEIKAGTAVAGLVVWPKAHLNATIPKPDGMPVTFQAEQLAKWIKLAATACTDGLHRPHLAGVCVRSCLGKIIVLGIDGRRVHCGIGDDAFEEVHRGEASFDSGVLIPVELVSSVEKLIGENGGDVNLVVGDNTAQVSAPMGWIRFTTPVDLPPDMTTILKEAKYSVEMQVDRLALLEAAIAAAPAGFGDAQQITLRSAGENLMIEANDGQGNEYRDFASATIKSKLPFCVSANASFLSDFLKGLNGDWIDIGYLSDVHALVCRQPDRYLVLMLMRGATK